MDRRAFLMGSAAMLCCTRMFAGEGENNLILGGGQYRTEKGEKLKFVLSVINIETNQRDITPLEFLAHGIHSNPRRPEQLAVFEKKGPHACEFDLVSRQRVRSIPTQKNRLFYGHGAYTLDGATLFSTETELEQLNGVIGIRSSRDLEYLGEFPSYGKEPHECKLIDGGKTLVVTNGGGSLTGDAPCVTYIDVASQQLIEKVALTNTHLNTGHLAVGPAGDLVVVSAPRRGLEKGGFGGVSIKSGNEDMQSIKNPANVLKRMRGEALSVAIHDTAGVAAVTHPEGGMVTFWDVKQRQLLKVIDLPYPRGVALTKNSESFLISYGDQASLVRVSVADFEIDSSSIFHGSYITGSHLYNWSRGMAGIFYPRGIF